MKYKGFFMINLKRLLLLTTILLTVFLSCNFNESSSDSLQENKKKETTNPVLKSGKSIMKKFVRFEASSSGSLQLKTTKYSMDSVLNHIKYIIEKMDHDSIKEEITKKYKDFDKRSISNITISYTQFWAFGEGDREATVIVRVNVPCNISEFDEADEIIKYYESFIIPLLKENGYKPFDNSH